MKTAKINHFYSVRFWMPLLIWIKSVIINAWFDFTDNSDSLKDRWLEKANEYVFFTLFFIPLIPLRCRQSIRVDEHWKMYKRKVTVAWKIINQLFSIIWVFIFMILFWMVASVFTLWHVHRVRF